MTHEQYRWALKRTGLSQGRAAKLLGISRRASAGYARDEYPIPPTIAILMRLLTRGIVKPEDIEEARS